MVTRVTKFGTWVRACGALAVVSLLPPLAGGCSTAEYRGATPSVRKVSDYPDARNYYVGMNFNFAVDQGREYHRASPPDAAFAGNPAGASAGGAATASTGGE